jgi:hypothetical protein
MQAAGVHMNVVYLGVLAGQDVGIIVVLMLVLMSLLGAAMLLLSAMGKGPLRTGAARNPRPVPLTLPCVGQIADRVQPLHPGELARTSRAPRAPPCTPPEVDCGFDDDALHRLLRR